MHTGGSNLACSKTVQQVWRTLISIELIQAWTGDGARPQRFSPKTRWAALRLKVLTCWCDWRARVAQQDICAGIVGCVYVGCV